MSHTKKRSDTPRFQVGDKVRVKSGLIDPDFPDIPLGGWTGTVTEIIEHEGQINCVFKLDDRTPESIHPIYRKRSERDGLDFETMGLGETDLEPDDGTPVASEQPTQIKTLLLSMDDQDDRIRTVFGLAHEDLPPKPRRGWRSGNGGSGDDDLPHATGIIGGALMAKQKPAKTETKTEFLRKTLGRDPNLEHRQVNRRWSKAGHTGEISNALFYQVRAKLGIKTEWVWVMEGKPVAPESELLEPKQQETTTDPLVEAAQSHLPHILALYKLFEENRPVMLFDLQSQKIYAYPYKEFKANLNERSQAILETQYQEATTENKIVVFVRDNESHRFTSMTFDAEGKTPDAALHHLRDLIAAGSKLTTSSVPSAERTTIHPGAGMYVGDPLFDQWRAEIEAYRQQIEDDPNIP